MASDPVSKLEVKDVPSAEKPKADEPKVEETVEEVATPEVPKVAVKLDPDYDGPTPVFVSTQSPDFDRVELTDEPLEVTVDDLESFVALPYVVKA